VGRPLAWTENASKRSFPNLREAATTQTRGLSLTQKKPYKKETDELLDEIDELLEENAEEFVRNYIQKGGE